MLSVSPVRLPSAYANGISVFSVFITLSLARTNWSTPPLLKAATKPPFGSVSLVLHTPVSDIKSTSLPFSAEHEYPYWFPVAEFLNGVTTLHPSTPYSAIPSRNFLCTTWLIWSSSTPNTSKVLPVSSEPPSPLSILYAFSVGRLPSAARWLSPSRYALLASDSTSANTG